MNPLPRKYDSDLDRLMHRAAEISEWPIQKLREELAGYDCSERPSRSDVKCQCGGMTRGDLILAVLMEEFEHSLNKANEAQVMNDINDGGPSNPAQHDAGGKA